MKRARILLGLTLAIAAAGCGSSHSGDETDDGDDLSGGAGQGDTSATEFSLGATEMGDQEMFQVRIDGAEPAPPIKYENDWVVTILDADGAPAEDVELFLVQPFMPTHGHDGTFEPTITPGDEPGTFRVDRINLWMGGVWEVRFFVRVGDVEDRVVISVFIED